MQGIVSKHTTVLAACAVCLCFGIGAGKQVTKPYKITGDVVGEILSVSPDYTITFKAINIGEATHSGRYYNELTGRLSLVTHQGTSEGLFVCADGSKITWTATINGTILTVTATGGTKRFQGGTGGFVAEMEDIVVDLKNKVLSYTFKGIGEVTY